MDINTLILVKNIPRGAHRVYWLSILNITFFQISSNTAVPISTLRVKDPAVLGVGVRRDNRSATQSGDLESQTIMVAAKMYSPYFNQTSMVIFGTTYLLRRSCVLSVNLTKETQRCT